MEIDIKIEKPVKKKHVYVGKVTTKDNKPYRLKIHSAKFVSLQRIPSNQGSILKIWFDNKSHDINTIITKLEETVLDTIINNNKKWFENELSLEDIKKFYRNSIDVLNNTLSILNENTEQALIIYNNNIVDSLNDINFSNTDLNLEIEIQGLYFFHKKCGIRWIIRKLMINTNNLDENLENWFDRKDIECEWENDLIILNKNIDDNCNELHNKISKLKEFKMEINDKFEESKNKILDTEWNKMLNNLSIKIIKYYDGIF